MKRAKDVVYPGSTCRVLNQDDCLAVNSGSNIEFANNYCEGGHGISIGSIKSGARVDGVEVRNCTVMDSENAVRIKTYDDASDAAVANISYRDIVFKGVSKFGIVVQQDYRNEGPTGNPGSRVPIRGVTLRNIRGSMKGDKFNKVYVLCGSGTCTGWDIRIEGSGGLVKSPLCRNADPKVQSSALCQGG